jgi:hypothetical protein
LHISIKLQSIFVVYLRVRIDFFYLFSVSAWSTLPVNQCRLWEHLSFEAPFMKESAVHQYYSTR